MNTKTATPSLPDQMELAARHRPELVTRLQLIEDWLVRTFGHSIEYRYASQVLVEPAWQTGATCHQFYLADGGPVDNMLWEWAYGLLGLKLQGEVIASHRSIPCITQLSWGEIVDLHARNGFVEVAAALCQQGRDWDEVTGQQFDLVAAMPQFMDETILHLNVLARMARDFPEIIRYESRYNQADWDIAANLDIFKRLTELAPPSVATRWWAVKMARGLVIDHLTDSHYADQFEKFDGKHLARTIARCCLKVLPINAADQISFICRVGCLARLRDFQNPQLMPVCLPARSHQQTP